jgi:hypothetical protein
MLPTVLRETLLLLNFYLDRYEGKTRDNLRNLRDHMQAVLEALEDERVPLDDRNGHRVSTREVRK